MTKRARKVCASPACPLLTVAGGSLCEEHEQARMQKYNARRPSAAQQGYGAEWQHIRDAHLADHPFCVQCGKRGSQVDHIKAKADGGTDDDSNLQTLCRSHHSQKTATHDGGFGNAKRKGEASATFWNGEPAQARKVRVLVGESQRPTWWCAQLVGTVREAVEVTYGNQIFYLDNEDGSGWAKVTNGRGSPQYGHRSLPVQHVVGFSAFERHNGVGVGA